MEIVDFIQIKRHKSKLWSNLKIQSTFRVFFPQKNNKAYPTTKVQENAKLFPTLTEVNANPAIFNNKVIIDYHETCKKHHEKNIFIFQFSFSLYLLFSLSSGEESWSWFYFRYLIISRSHTLYHVLYHTSFLLYFFLTGVDIGGIYFNKINSTHGGEYRTQLIKLLNFVKEKNSLKS